MDEVLPYTLAREKMTAQMPYIEKTNNRFAADIFCPERRTESGMPHEINISDEASNINYYWMRAMELILGEHIWQRGR